MYKLEPRPRSWPMKGGEGVLGWHWHGVCLIELEGAALQQPAGAWGGSGSGGLPGGGNGKLVEGRERN